MKLYEFTDTNDGAEYFTSKKLALKVYAESKDKIKCLDLVEFPNATAGLVLAILNGRTGEIGRTHVRAYTKETGQVYRDRK